jgi:hypothetical protein
LKTTMMGNKTHVQSRLGRRTRPSIVGKSRRVKSRAGRTHWPTDARASLLLGTVPQRSRTTSEPMASRGRHLNWRSHPCFSSGATIGWSRGPCRFCKRQFVVTCHRRIRSVAGSLRARCPRRGTPPSALMRLFATHHSPPQRWQWAFALLLFGTVARGRR